MIVANSSPLPNIDHTMCLMGGRGGGWGWGGRLTRGNDFLLRCASKTCGCTSTECFRACFLCRVWEKRVDLYLKEITIYNLSCVCVCVCCRQKHSSSLCVCVCEPCMCVCVCFQQYPIHQPIECYCILCFSAQICYVLSTRPPVRLLWSRTARRLVASCRVALANLLLRRRGFHHSLPLENQKRCSAAPRAKTH